MRNELIVCVYKSIKRTLMHSELLSIMLIRLKSTTNDEQRISSNVTFPEQRTEMLY